MNDILDDIDDMIEAGDFDFPAIPEIAQKAIEMSRSEKSTIADLVRIIEHEPVLCSSIISVVNSPAMRTAIEIKDLPTAIARLGMLYTCSFVIGVSLRNAFEASSKTGRVLISKTWKRADQVAEISSLFAGHANSKHTHEAVFAGLIHNIGELAVTRYIDEVAPHALDAWNQTSNKLEISAKIGDLAIYEWGLPKEYQNLCSTVLNQDSVGYIATLAVRCALLWNENDDEFENSTPGWMDSQSVEKLGLPNDLSCDAFKFLMKKIRNINHALDVRI